MPAVDSLTIALLSDLVNQFSINTVANSKGVSCEYFVILLDNVYNLISIINFSISKHENERVLFDVLENRI